MAELSERDIARPPSPFARKIAPAIVTLAALFAFGAAVWYTYNRGAPAGEGGVTPIIRAQPGPVRERPENPGGLQVPNQDKQVWSRISPLPQEPVRESLAPSPEEPVAKPPAAPPTAPSAPSTVAGNTDDPIGALIARQETPAAAPAPATTPRSVLPEPSRPPLATVTVPPVRTVPPQPVAPAAAPASNAPAAAGQVRIQVASLASEADAERQARRLRQRFGALLGDASTLIQRADLGSRGVFFRLQFVGFTDRQAARAACADLKRRKQDCLVVVR